MSNHAWILLGLFLVVLLLTVKPLGTYIANVMEGRFRLAGKIESPIYRLCGIRQDEEMGWLKYAFAILLFNVLGALAVYALQRLQVWLPLNPQAFANVSPDSAFNTAISFATNTNWQGYGGEVDDELPDPDAGAGGAELLLGRHRHRRRHRADPRLCPAHAPRRSATPGSI